MIEKRGRWRMIDVSAPLETVAELDGCFKHTRRGVMRFIPAMHPLKYITA